MEDWIQPLTIEGWRVRNGALPAVSVNKDVTVISNRSPPMWLASPKGTQERGEYLWSSSHQDCRHSLWWAPLGKKLRILAQDSWDTYELNFSEPRRLHLPILRKALISLTWDILFSSINNNLLKSKLPVLSKTSIWCLLPVPPWSSSLRVTWDAVSWVWSPKNPHWIKHIIKS